MANAINSFAYNSNTYTFTLPFGTCSTAAGTAAKAVTVDSFSLEAQARVSVKFTYANSAASPTLNVNGTGAKAIYWHGAALPSSQYWEAGAVLDFVYNGTQWELIGVAKDNNTDTNTDTKNTAGSTDSSSKLFLIGATSQAANPQTYSHDTAYVDTDGCLYSNSTKVSVNGHTHDDRYYTESEINTKLNGKLDKLTYEWNKSYNAGGTAGYLLIGSFPMYDTNVTIDIDATTSTTYHGTVVIATQNVSETSIGSSKTVTVYGDPTGAISDAIRVVWTSGSRNYNVYFVPSTWSKNLIHIRAIGNYLENIDESKICTQFTTGTAPTTTSGITIVNALKSNFAASSHTHSYAASSHNHAASNITSGTLSSDRLPTVPIAKGGTGATTAAGALTNLGLTATAAELNYCDGVTSNIQTQLNGKAASSHTHSDYLSIAGGSLNGNLDIGGNLLMNTNKVILGGAALQYSSNTLSVSKAYSDSPAASITCPTFIGALSGNATTATTATKLGSNAGSATQPVYFSGGKPVACTYTLGKSVPSNAVFTDTTYSAGTGISLSGTTFSNSGVRSIATGSSNGTISVNTNGTSADVAVKGLGTAAYTASTAYADASHTHYRIENNSSGNTDYIIYTGTFFRSGTTNEKVTLGGASYKWNVVYAKNGSIQTSDLNKKRDLAKLLDDERYLRLFDLIDPYKYCFKNGDRVHTGFISQYVEEALDEVGLTAEECGFFCKDIDVKPKYDDDGNYIGDEEIYDDEGNPVYIYSLRYEEYIAITVAKVKLLEAKYNKKLEEIDAKLAELEAKLNA